MVSDPECPGTRRAELDVTLSQVVTLNCNTTPIGAFAAIPDIIDLQSQSSPITIALSGGLFTAELSQYGPVAVDVYNQDGDFVQQANATIIGNDAMQITPNTQEWFDGAFTLLIRKRLLDGSVTTVGGAHLVAQGRPPIVYDPPPPDPCLPPLPGMEAPPCY